MSNGSTNTIRQLLAAASPLAVFAAPAWRRASKIVSGSTAKNGTLALLDQLLVSGISFATTVLIGRSCGPGELGAYSVGFTVVVIAFTVLNALVLVPYTVHVNRWHNRQKRIYAGATLVQAAVLGGLAAASVCAWAALPKAGPAGSGGISTVAWGLAIAIPLLVLREYLRRIAFANFQAQRALLLDVAIVAIQMLGLLALAAAGSLTAGRAYLWIGVACASVIGAWLVLDHRQFRMRARSWRPALNRNWRFGRWVLCSQLVSRLHSEMLILWLVVLVLGQTASGTFAACASIVLFSKPFLLGISHVLTPRISRAWFDGGNVELRRVVAKAAVATGAAMSALCIAVVAWGGSAVTVLYGPEYAGHGMTVSLLAVSALIHSLEMVIGSGLHAVNRPEVNLQANLVGLAVTLIAACLLIGLSGFLGAALALLIGKSVQAAVRISRFCLLTAV